MRKFLAVLSVIALLAVMLPMPCAKATNSDDKIIRIGLYYGTSALDEARLQNVTGFGSGYLIGYMDEDDEFVSFGYIPNVYLTMVNGDTYHVLEPEPYKNYTQAENAASAYREGFVRYAEGEYYVLIDSYPTAADAQRAASAYGLSSCGCHTNTVTVKDTQTDAILFQFRSSKQKLAIKPVFENKTWFSDDGSRRAITWFKTNQYRGIFEYYLSDSSVCVNSVVSIGDYIKGVVPYEMSGSWPLEALKAQAICARTYAVANLDKHSSLGFNLCASTCCQAYRGEGSANGRTEQAVDDTTGMYITYNSKPINAVYCSSNGGATEDCENIWSEAIPYLRAVRDNYEQYVNTGRSEWNYTITLSEITSILRARGAAITGSIENAWAEYTDAGNIKSLHFIDSSGKDISYSGERCRTVFNTASSSITIYSQRYIFEDAENPRILSNAQITNLPGGPAEIDEADNSASVLTSSGLTTSAALYGTSIPILSADGLSEAISFYTTAGNEEYTPEIYKKLTAADLIPPDSCSGIFIISGSGWGHNLGMSQYGAKAMAERGLSAEDIIHQYYTNVKIEYIR